MPFNGGAKLIKVTLRNPLDKADLLDYYIVPYDHQLAKDWVVALKEILQTNLLLEKNVCFLGFPNTARSLEYLCAQLNYHVDIINSNLGERYHINERYTPKYLVDNNLGPNHFAFNSLHNHFERLQGTVDNLSEYYLIANAETKYAIRQLNNICHELESLILSRRKQQQSPEWVRPSQITTWLTANRYALKDEHRQLFVQNGYDRRFGEVYMHWAQIGKTYYEVFRDEESPTLNNTVCEAITSLMFYSGEFDIEWARSVTYADRDWWREEMDKFYAWLDYNGIDKNDPKNSLGYLPIGYVDLERSFGTTDVDNIWKQLETHLDIYKVEVDGVCAIYEDVWSDEDFIAKQIAKLQPGYQVHKA